MKKILLAAATVAMAAAAAAEPYRVIVPTDAQHAGAMARLVNYDSGEAVDSALVGEQSVTFTGEIDEPILAAVQIAGMRPRPFVLESGTISFGQNDGMAFGSMLNDQLRQFGAEVNALNAQFRQAETEEQQEAIYARYEAMSDSMLQANTDNPLGYYMLLSGDAATMSAAELRQLMQQYPQFAQYRRIQNFLATAERRGATQPGGRYIDFEVTHNGVTKKLSDYMEPGKYLLVDFWASWCGPCLRQLPVLKELYHTYHDRGLNVLGVAVWDEPANTERAIVEHELPWPCIIDAQTIPTDLYGISGIPCIMLIGPDGTIISRDKQGDELKAEVTAALQAGL